MQGVLLIATCYAKSTVLLDILSMMKLIENVYQWLHSGQSAC